MTESTTIDKPKTPTTFRKGCLAIIFGLFLLVLAFIVADILVGIFAGDDIRHNIFKLDPRRDIALTPGADVRYPVEVLHGGQRVYPSAASQRSRTYGIKINSLGFRGPETSLQAAQGMTRIVCTGDSCTFGWGLDDGDTYVRRLEGILKSDSIPKKYEALNLGIFSYSSQNGMIYLKDFGLSLDPKVVVISYGINDSRPLGSYRPLFSKGSDSQAMPLDIQPGRRAKIRTWMLNTFLMPIVESDLALYLRFKMVMRVMARSAKNKRNIPPGAGEQLKVLTSSTPARVTLDEYERNLGAMASMCAARGAKVVFLSFNLDPKYSERMKIVAGGLGAPYLEDMEIFKRRWDEALNSEKFKKQRQWSIDNFGPDILSREPIYYFRMDVIHPTPLADELIAEELADAIRKLSP